ncbi:hypothetical protein RIR_jg32665.t2 [Rhizophagus irregularis DAOM 181602=DAOM 197198]|nr:hypothetical protein RIR_jg32665.t2 [Rhizophagus irregularis DAOM 181602=DAOM 197198]
MKTKVVHLSKSKLTTKSSTTNSRSTTTLIRKIVKTVGSCEKTYDYTCTFFKINDEIRMMNKNMDSDKEIAVINREITVINRKNSAIKGNIGEKIQMLKVKIDLFYLTNSKKEGGGVIWNRNRFHH